jgi:hypothetical protein
LRLGGCRASALLRVRRWHWEVSEGYARNGTVIGFPVGLPDVQLLMLAPGVSIYTETEEQFRQEVLKVGSESRRAGLRLWVWCVCVCVWGGGGGGPPAPPRRATGDMSGR